MQEELQHHIDTIIAAAQALISRQDGELSDRQEQFVRAILTNAEQFIHLATRFIAEPPAYVSDDLRHELSNPLTPMYGYSELLMKRTMETLTPAQRQHVVTISQSTDELRRIVEYLLKRGRSAAASS
ncbi:MAG: hypothetical protein EA396_07510 [Anaerolineaceae bacterium]|nr:MAG: hypothetical protein EA396_07510 [Anaerolineaceae bacterium]